MPQQRERRARNDDNDRRLSPEIITRSPTMSDDSRRHRNSYPVQRPPEDEHSSTRHSNGLSGRESSDSRYQNSSYHTPSGRFFSPASPRRSDRPNDAEERLYYRSTTTNSSRSRNSLNVLPGSGPPSVSSRSGTSTPSSLSTRSTSEQLLGLDRRMQDDLDRVRRPRILSQSLNATSRRARADSRTGSISLSDSPRYAEEREIRRLHEDARERQFLHQIEDQRLRNSHREARYHETHQEINGQRPRATRRPVIVHNRSPSVEIEDRTGDHHYNTNSSSYRRRGDR